MDTIDDLLDFWRARLDDEEQIAQAAPGDYFYGDGHGDAVAAFLRRWNPADSALVLADIAAKRAIIDGFSHEAGETRAVRHLVAVYAAHPDYREAWRP